MKCERHLGGEAGNKQLYALSKIWFRQWRLLRTESQAENFLTKKSVLSLHIYI